MASTGRGRHPLASTWFRAAPIRKPVLVGTDGVAHQASWAAFFFDAGGAEEHFGTAVLTGGGVVATVNVKGGQSTQTLTGGGVMAATGAKGGQSAPALTGGGALVATGVKGGMAATGLTGGGVIIVASTTGRSAVAALTGSGVVTWVSRS